MVTFANLGSVRRPSTKFEVRRPSRSEDTAHLVCQLSINNNFPVIRTTIAKNHHFYVPRPSLFVCPGDAPAAITQNVAWMKRQFSACQTPHSMYPSILNSFPVIRTTSAKNRRFHIPQPTFLFLLKMPLRLSRNMLHEWKDISTLVQHFAACTHLSSTVSSYSNRKSKKSQFSCTAAHIFVFPGDAPAISCNMLHGWKDNSMLAKSLAACTYLYSIVSELYDA